MYHILHPPCKPLIVYLGVGGSCRPGERRTENREQKTENREQRTENREQRTENRTRDKRATERTLGKVEGFEKNTKDTKDHEGSQRLPEWEPPITQIGAD